jgi:hypothetical protein
VGDYAAVTLSKYPGSDTPLDAGDLTPDFLGNLPVSTVYDRTLPATDGAKYSYRVKAVKGTDTQYKTASSQPTVNAKTYIRGSISVAAKGGVTPAPAAVGNTTYAITPEITYKDALQTGDKLVLYWVRGDYEIYRNGPYLETNKVEFTKAQLEAGTAQTLTVPANTNTGEYLYVQAYLVFADGTRQNVQQYASFSWNYSSWSYTGGIAELDSYGSSTQVYYAKLDY